MRKIVNDPSRVGNVVGDGIPGERCTTKHQAAARVNDGVPVRVPSPQHATSSCCLPGVSYDLAGKSQAVAAPEETPAASCQSGSKKSYGANNRRAVSEDPFPVGETTEQHTRSMLKVLKPKGVCVKCLLVCWDGSQPVWFGAGRRPVVVKVLRANAAKKCSPAYWDGSLAMYFGAGHRPVVVKV